MIKPNFLIVGVARCGTTSIYHYLNQHPQVAMAKKKEPKYFSSINISFPHNGVGDKSVDSVVIRDRDEYFNLFKKFDKFRAIGEASSDYLYFHKEVIESIKEELGDVKIIISIRNPIDRAYSAYNNLLRDGREKLSFRDGLDREESRIEDNWDWMWAYKKGGLYSNAIKDFQDNFSNVKIVLFDELNNNSNGIMSDIFDFLEVDNSIKVDTNTKYSHSGKAKSPIIKYISNRDNKLAFLIRKIIMGLVPRSLLESVAKRVLSKDDMNMEDREYLREYFREDIEATSRLIGRDLSHWE
ncbi:Sulfotransferase [hydrothermal vent metagenome]|uniref:Sulfotransferase n=1 Tax=hydrothermal vent metagenome TaxID=652676 RepID=A0A1W1EKQ4_9ZZZZ